MKANIPYKILLTLLVRAWNLRKKRVLLLRRTLTYRTILSAAKSQVSYFLRITIKSCGDAVHVHVHVRVL